MIEEISQEPEVEKDLLYLIQDSQGRLLDDVPITEAHFFNPANRTVFLAMKEIVESGLHLDYQFLTSALSGRGQLESVGGPGELSYLSVYRASYANRSALFNKVNNALIRRKLREISHIALEASNPGPDAVSGIVSTLEERLASLDPSSAGNDVLHEVCDATAKRLDDIMEGKLILGTPTGIEAWDDAFGGIVPGWMYVIAARQGVGKTAMMEQMCTHILADFKVPICVFSCDMDPHQLIMRMACRDAGVSMRDVQRGKASVQKAEEVKANVLILKKTKFRLHNISGINSEKLISTCKYEMRKNGCRIFFLDHIQLMRANPGEDRRTAIVAASQAISSFCTKYNVSFVTLAHLNRNSAEETAQAHHIKESDDVLGDCDGMVLLYSKQDKEDLDPGDPWEVEFKIGKNRLGPEGRIYPLDFNREQMSFSERKYRL